MILIYPYSRREITDIYQSSASREQSFPAKLFNENFEQLSFDGSYLELEAI